VHNGDPLPVPETPDNFAVFSEREDRISSNSEEQQQPPASRDAEFLPSTDSSKHKITEGELSDLLKDLEHPKSKAERFALKLYQWNLLHNKGK